ncbi:phosphatidylserine/phosphatidylglycerophosphate/cardiolipin synthase family protein [Halomicroarcula sp. GCM10025817]|uniref:phospholipase D-like domain-containing protein n=1 Tax=Haloarcula TaxID=2237 RepID=UPI0023E83F06|nr:phospholipase D-like domain-containing protein [Halomicroarcula sp. SYNS111]
MRRLVTVALVVSLLIVSPAAGGTPPPDTPTPPEQSSVPQVHAVYPNPVAGGDRGEFVVLSVPPGTELARYALTDGRSTVELPNGTVEGRVAVTADPRRVRNLTDAAVVGVNGSLELANGGDTVSLRRANHTVQRVRYADAVEGEVGVVHGSTLRWRPLGATDRPVVGGGPADVRVFTLPDAPRAPLRAIRRADRRVYLAGYTLTSARVADALVAAQRRGADVRVLLEGEPVGGRTRAGARTLDRLAGAGIEVRLVAGPHARYRYHHAKYAVADDRAVVLTENWKPAGTGGNSSRGWGVETGQPAVVDGLAATFRADAGWRDAVRWSTYRDGRRFERGEPATASYPRRFDPETVSVDRTTLLVTPDNAQRELVARVDGATSSVDVVQPTVGAWDEPLLRALRSAARRGITVRLLLSSAWYVREENRRTVERFDRWADRTGAPLTARLADPSGRYAKIHAKGAVVDDRAVVLGSLNWNEQAATANRETVLVLHGRDVASYYGAVFDADWRGGTPNVPVGIVAAAAGALAVAGLALRRVRFGSNAGVGPP